MTDAALLDLAAERLGGAVLAANDEFFAEKENLLREAEPVFVPDRYTDRGKWMDGWETRRRRTPGHDWAILRLGLPGVLRRVIVDTSHFKGNYPESCSLDALAAPDDADPAWLVSDAASWIEVLPRSLLQGDFRNQLEVASHWRWTHLRLNIYPDGGVARLRALGEVIADWRGAEGAVDLAAVERGGRVVDVSDRFFGTPDRLLLPGAPRGMHDGWETRRRRGPGNDWVVVRLGAEGQVEGVEVDTSFFKGNAPGSCALSGCASPDEVPSEEAAWRELLPETPLSPDTRHRFADEIRRGGPTTHVRLEIFPDGGVARLRVFGAPTSEGRLAAALRWLSSLPPEEAESSFLTCCGSREWARRMAAARPFADHEALLHAADEVWAGLSPAEWREALDSHPRLGERPSGDATESRWAAAEQSGAAGAGRDTLARLAEANRRYAERFGWTFVVCAAGRSAEEMLAAYEGRGGNDPQTELGVAAEEQRKITRLRLAKLLGMEGERSA
ncbi:MAG TPA: allantoicase [Thermoanaerobaculia bacterium]|nr:allantoicase [Thermoanaerobaculia bacterium]